MKLRDAWLHAVVPGDYDQHMERNGQAAANAALVADLLMRFPPSPEGRVLIAGAGTGQLLALAPRVFAELRLLCTDINPVFLDQLSATARSSGLASVKTAVDDIEDTRLQPGFDTIIVVLVLEHVDWRRALASLASLGARQMIVVIQQNPASSPAVLSASPTIAGTMRVFLQAQPALIPPAALVKEARKHQFVAVAEESADVADRKAMRAFVLSATGLNP
jgi:SAM-dependent methyltransferase